MHYSRAWKVYALLPNLEVSNKFCIVLHTFTYLNVSADGITSIRECCSLNYSNMLLVQTICCAVHCETKSCIIQCRKSINNICHCLEPWNMLADRACTKRHLCFLNSRSLFSLRYVNCQSSCLEE